MTLIACTQGHVIPDECPECGGWLHTTTHGGIAGPAGSYCTEDCAMAAQTWIKKQARDAHLHLRDLVCACEVCVAAGHPTDTETTQWWVEHTTPETGATP